MFLYFNYRYYCNHNQRFAYYHNSYKISFLQVYLGLHVKPRQIFGSEQFLFVLNSEEGQQHLVRHDINLLIFHKLHVLFVLQMAVKQEKQDERAAVNQKAEELLKDYGNSILRMAYAYLHNMSDAEDILQETLIQYLQTAPVLENPAHEKAWLLKVAANLSKNRIDYNRIRQTDELEETLVAEKREDLRFVWEAVRALPEK